MSDHDKPNGFDRLDQRIGSLWSRFWGTVLGIGSAALLLTALSSDDFSLSGYWPALVGAAVLAFLAAACFRSREGMLSILSDVGVSKRKP